MCLGGGLLRWSQYEGDTDVEVLKPLTVASNKKGEVELADFASDLWLEQGRDQSGLCTEWQFLQFTASL